DPRAVQWGNPPKQRADPGHSAHPARPVPRAPPGVLPPRRVVLAQSESAARLLNRVVPPRLGQRQSPARPPDSSGASCLPRPPVTGGTPGASARWIVPRRGVRRSIRCALRSMEDVLERNRARPAGVAGGDRSMQQYVLRTIFAAALVGGLSLLTGVG